MKKAFSLKNYIQKYITIYLVSIVAVSLLSIWVIDFKNKPKRYETFGVFYSSLQINTNKSTSFVKKLSLDSIKEVKSYKYRYENMNFWDYFSANGLSNSDVFFLNKDAVDNLKETNNCISIASVYANTSLEMYNEISYKVFNSEAQSGPLKSFMDGEITEDYFVCINKNSPHIGLNNNGKTDNASIFLEVLFNEKN